MSAAKRRRKAQLAKLVKLDANHSWLCLMKSPRRDGPRALRLWWACIVPLGDALEKKKPGAWAALPRYRTGPDILMDTFHERNPHRKPKNED